MKLAKAIKLVPIRTFLVYFIIASLLLIAFRYPFNEAPKEASVQTATASITINPPVSGVCNESSTKTQRCGLGPCESVQTATCVNGIWAYEMCQGNRWASPEICDGIDNDCDGYIDNRLNPPRCELTLGVCNGSYYKKCGGSAGWIQCIDSDYDRWLYEPSERTCFDGYDNDCDGATDYFDRDCVTRDSTRY